MAVTSIRNETPSRLTLTSIAGTQIVLAPLQEKEIAAESEFDFDDLEREGILTQRSEAPSKLGENIATTVLGGGFWLVMLGIWLANAEPRFGISPAVWPYAIWGTAFVVLLAVVAGFIIKGTNSFALVTRWTMQAVALTVILAIGLGLPAATIYYFGGGAELLAGAGDAAVVAPAAEAPPPEETALPPGAAPPAGKAGPGTAVRSASLALFGRLIQLALIATASLLPVLLFFLFDRYQLDTLRRQLYVNLFRLDRSMTTTGEINAKYGSEIREAYGTDDQGRGRLSPGTRWPVLVCAFVVTIGWVITLAPVGTDFSPAAAADVLEALLPQRAAFVFGFLGVYFYSLRLIALRYARGDLKPKAYTHIMVRVFIVLVLSWVLEAVFTGDSTIMLLLAFLFGITPDEFFTWVKEFFRGKVPASAMAQPALPLNDLEGIDLYDLGRLESEGIVNIEGLAHHELTTLIIETRIPVPRLVDWIDQAVLYLHLSGGSDDNARTKLRDYGIRTATDLLRAWDQACKRGADELEAFKKLLGDDAVPYRLEVIRDALLDDEWMSAVVCWRDDVPHPPLERSAVPSSRDALEERAGKELMRKRYGAALQLLEKALEIQDTARVRRMMALLLATLPVGQRDLEGARAHAEQAFELAPDDYEGLLELIRFYLVLEDGASARRMLDAALRQVQAWPSSKDKDREEATKSLDELREQIDALSNVGVGQAAAGE